MKVKMEDIYNSWLVKKMIAHRGLHNEKYPENSLSAFENAIKNGYAIETDVHLSKDNKIVVFHDDNLLRMTGLDKDISDLSLKKIKELKLNGTDETIPTFDEFLNCIAGRTEILIETKNVGKSGPLEERLYKALKKYSGEYAVQSFNPFSMGWFYKNAPEVARGQLSGWFSAETLKSPDGKMLLSSTKRIILRSMVLNKISKPNFISYDYKFIPNKHLKKYRKLPLLTYTVTSQNIFNKMKRYVDNIIFQDFIPKDNLGNQITSIVHKEKLWEKLFKKKKK